MNFFQKDIETMPRKELEALQLERLKKIVAYCYNNTKFYHDKLDKAGVGDGSKIKVLSDIEYIPLNSGNENLHFSDKCKKGIYGDITIVIDAFLSFVS